MLTRADVVLLLTPVRSVHNVYGLHGHLGWAAIAIFGKGELIRKSSSTEQFFNHEIEQLYQMQNMVEKPVSNWSVLNPRNVQIMPWL